MSDLHCLRLKKLSPSAVAKALARAAEFRATQESREAASIYRDILEIDPGNQEALVGLILSLTDQFAAYGPDISAPLHVLARVTDEYTRHYHLGLIYERWAKAHLFRGIPDPSVAQYFWRAMASFELAEALRPPDNDDAILRWNSCLRHIRGDLVGVPLDAEDTSSRGIDADFVSSVESGWRADLNP